MEFRGKEYEKPEEGKHEAVLADVVNMGLVELTYEGRTTKEPMVKFVYFLKTLNSEGQQFRISERFTVKFGKKAGLRNRLNDFGITSRGFNSDQIVGQTGYVLITHNEKPSGTYANVSKFRPAKLDVSIPSDFVRAPENPGEEAA